mmetsp:Transcript_9161/g.10371  ORF Transcript_9161/g.10371 Transcript_9161/m.10371 type:complete len:293 (+) Transcript_9161:199-1077(+)
MCIDIIREFLEFYRMDYTLSTFLPECSLSQEPKSRADIEAKVGLNSSSTSMPLLMHLINNCKNGGGSAPPQTNNFIEPQEQETKEERSATDDLLWENKNMDIKQQLDDNSSKKSPSLKSPSLKSPDEDHSVMSSLNDLPPLGGAKKNNLQPLEFNPKESPQQDKFGDSVEQEKKNLDEVDKKLKEFESDGLRMEMDRTSPDKNAESLSNSKPNNMGGFDDYEDDFDEDIDDNIDEDLPVEDFDPTESRDKNPEFGESGISASQSMGIDPSVNSLDIDEYDHIEQAVISSPFK